MMRAALATVAWIILAAGTVHVAPPTGDAATDRAGVESALAAVQPGGTIGFAPGTYAVGQSGAAGPRTAAPRSSATRPAAYAPERAEPNDQRRRAGRMVDGELHVALVATEAEWRPRGEGGPRLVGPVFAEEGRAPQVPGPLIRAPAGTPIRVRVRNALGEPVMVRGLVDRAAMSVSRPAGTQFFAADFLFADSLVVPAGETREVRFTAAAELSSFYYGRVAAHTGLVEQGFNPGGMGPGGAFEGAFLGALVVDPPDGAAQHDERVFLITRWASADEPGSLGNWRLFINGLSWPHTERLEYALGDTIHWRVINASLVDHPMHLHGFYFDVIARGDTDADTLYAAGSRPSAVTEWMPELSSLRLRWVPDEPGNWLFHCHLIRHMGPMQRFAADGALPPMEHDHDMHHMAGLVLGVTVRPPPGWRADDSPAARRIDLWTGARPNVFDGRPALAFVAQRGEMPPPADSIAVPGTTLVLRRGEATQIVVHNRLDFPFSVHWHGLELRSAYDGVGHWSGEPGATRPPILPGESQSVFITPRRAGTFMYHIHGESGHELTQGMYGAFLVLERDEPGDLESDRAFVLSARGARLDATPVINGVAEHAPERFEPARAYRLRFMHISADDLKRIRLLRDGAPVTWRPLAKDGADVPERLRAPQPAVVALGVGETADFEWTPDTPGVYVLEVQTRFYPALPAPPALQRVAFGVGTVSDDALAAAAFVPAAPAEPPAVHVAADALAAFQGRYTAETLPPLEIRLDGDDLVLHSDVLPQPARLIPIGDGDFRIDGVPFVRLEFRSAAAGAVALTIVNPDGTRMRLAREE
jgi:manganese oxidase